MPFPLRFPVARVSLAFVILGAWSPQVRGSAPPGDAAMRAEVARLVLQLGSDVFWEREAASKALLGIGEFAWEALRQAADASPDLETRHRARRLLEFLERRRELSCFRGHSQSVNRVA